MTTREQNDDFKGSETSEKELATNMGELTLEQEIGRTRKVLNTRGSIPFVSQGDKSYSVPEYSPNFHQVGSTRPAINFSRSSDVICDTFIPLQPLQKISRQSYFEKNKQRLKDEEVQSVVMLSKWKPSHSLSTNY